LALRNLRSTETYTRSFWDWTFLNACFVPTKIRVSDIEGIVERHGNFLWIETKYPGENIEEGQRIMHESALKTGRFTVLLIWGEPNRPFSYRLLFANRRPEEGLVNREDEIAAVVRRWFVWADGQAA
jgi:hypothetical protein